MTNKPMLLSTIDNPHDPFESFPQWYFEDVRLGYHTSELIANYAGSAGLLNDGGEREAMRIIIGLNLSGKHIVVIPDDYDPFLKPHLKQLGVSE